MSESISAASTTDALSAPLRWAGYTLGFAIGGFFDGILLHQILQWHHLLSGLQDGRFGNLRFQILADGLFHLLMYVLALLGLILLWRSRAEYARQRADRLLLACALIGFGSWHIVDGIGSHWLLGIHRIRMDSQIPLVWDLFWFFFFGIFFIILGWLIRPTGGMSGRSRGRAPMSLAALAILMGVGGAIQPAGNSVVLVVFRPGVAAAQAMDAVASVNGRLLWSDPSDQVWAVALPENRRAFDLYGRGALLVSGTIGPAGCINWTRI